ncbi:hypothetical protein [Streptomyces rishiriensis]|uniref:hypothetical protein n=1 Tax=Streptomyces rishiriensis TaxID=68264 RepID=UPI00131F35D7|nr:hypothetical protein [Streptomyces rishiriensis]
MTALIRDEWVDVIDSALARLVDVAGLDVSGVCGVALGQRLGISECTQRRRHEARCT